MKQVLKNAEYQPSTVQDTTAEVSKQCLAALAALKKPFKFIGQCGESIDPGGFSTRWSLWTCACVRWCECV